MKISSFNINIANGIVYLLTMLISGLPAIITNSIYGYLPVITLITVLLVSSGYILLIRKNLQIEGTAENIACRRNEKVAFAISVINAGRLPVPKAEIAFLRSDVAFEREHIQKTDLYVPPRKKKDFAFSIVFNHIGMYRAGVKSITVCDFLGIINFTYTPDRLTEVCVSPGLNAMKQLNISMTAASESPRSAVTSPADSMDYAGVREYRFGDPIKSIHWKLSAHTRTYMTRQNESSSNPGTTVFADFLFEEPDRERWLDLADIISESAVASAYDCVTRGVDCEIMYKGIQGGFQSFMPERFDDFSTWVANIPFKERSLSEFNEKLTQLRSLQMGYRYSNVVFCTADPDENVIALLTELHQHGKNVIAIIVIPDDVYDEDYERLVAPLKKLSLARIEFRILRAGKSGSAGAV